MSDSPDVIVETVEGLGTFTFRKRNLRLEFATNAERTRLSEGTYGQMSGFEKLFIEAVADLKVLLVDPPEGWAPADIDEMDPFDDETYARVLKVWSALRGKEETFRKARKAVSPGG